MPGLVALTLAYVLSQFYRSCLAVLTPALRSDLGMAEGELSSAAGAWFLGFALMQIPVGEALDRIGPRATAAALLGLGGGGGAALMAVAGSPGMVIAAMALIGAGCAPVLMAAYHLLARGAAPARFATLAAMILGIGSLGNLAGAAPLAAAVTGFGWRQTLWGLACITVLVAVLAGLAVRDPPRLRTGRGDRGGSALSLLGRRELWPVLAMMAACYAPAAGIRGLWAGPWLEGRFGLDIAGIGDATFLMAAAMIAGSFVYGPLDRLLGTRKWVILPGNLMVAAACTALALIGPAELWLAAPLLALLGFFGATYPVVIAHGRSFLAPAEVGRGVTLLNFFGIGGAGLMQLLTGALPGDGPGHFTAVFAAYAMLALAGCLAYAAARDRTD